MNLYGRIPKRAGQPVQPVKGRSMQLQYRTGTQFKRPLCILHVRANDIECQCELPEAVFGFTPRNLVGIG